MKLRRGEYEGDAKSPLMYVLGKVEGEREGESLRRRDALPLAIAKVEDATTVKTTNPPTDFP
jgi:hypothetical protein